jgi:hypothetical protein
MKHLVSILFATVFGLAPLGAIAQTTGPVEPGMVLSGTMDSAIASNTAHIGDRFVISNVSSGADGMIANATIDGHVAAVSPASQGHNARVRLSFDWLRLYDGKQYPLDARPIHINVVTKSNATKEGAGAIVGDLLGNWIGQTIGVGLLGPLGLIGGYLVAKNARQNVTIPQNSLVTMQVIRPLRQA